MLWSNCVVATNISGYLVGGSQPAYYLATPCPTHNNNVCLHVVLFSEGDTKTALNTSVEEGDHKRYVI